MKRKQLTKICMMIPNWKKNIFPLVYKQILQRFKDKTLSYLKLSIASAMPTSNEWKIRVEHVGRFNLKLLNLCLIEHGEDIGRVAVCPLPGLLLGFRGGGRHLDDDGGISVQRTAFIEQKINTLQMYELNLHHQWIVSALFVLDHWYAHISLKL